MVVRIVLAMTIAFKLNFNVSVGRGRSTSKGVQVSDRAKQLAEEVNKRQADQQVKDRLQLHKAEILRAKGQDFWNNFAIIFRTEFIDFNNHLNVAEYRIETFDDRSTPRTIKLHGGKSGSHATCVVDVEAQTISATGVRPGAPNRFTLDYRLSVDDEDNVRIRNNAGGGGVVSESDVAIEVLKFFAS